MPLPRRRASFSALALLIASFGLLVLSWVEHSGLKTLRWQLAELVSPLLSAAVVPIEPIRWAAQQLTMRRDLHAENARLKDENQRLTGWEWRARDLERRLDELAKLANVVDQSPVTFATARAIADSSGPFVRAAIIDAGRQHNLRNGNPVISADGLVGRLVETGQRAARVLLITDLNSRIPVQIGANGVAAVLSGDNGPEPRLQFIAPDARVAFGDEVSTSGVGGMFPRGLRIGRVVADSGGGLRIAPHARLEQLDYVSVLLTDLPAQELADETRMPPLDARSRRAQIRAPGDNR